MTSNGHVLSTNTNVSSKDLRAVLGGIMINGKEYIAIGDRNKTLSLFYYDANTNTIKLENSFEAHDGWISSVAYMKPCDRYPKGALITGAYDNQVKVWDPESLLSHGSEVIEPLQKYSHDKQVCFITTCQDDSSRIISTGWDSTCRIWNEIPEETIILRHEFLAVWCASQIPGGYLTCGADQTIRIWNEKGEHVTTIQNAHDAPIRNCVYIPSKNIFVTCSNDGKIKEWKVNGLSLEFLSSIICPQSYLYTICLLDENTYIVSSDNCTYIASSETKKIQDILFLPGIVWSVSTLSNKDIICSCENGNAQTFTRDPSRRCDSSIENEYFEKLGSLPNEELKKINPLKIPKINKINSEIPKLGTQEILRKGNQLVVYMWNIGYDKYIQVGSYDIEEKYQKIVDGTDDQGNIWDFKFPIQLKDGQSFSLFMNQNANKYTATYDFMKKNNLDPKTYLVEVINIINKYFDVNLESNLPMKKLSYFKDTISKSVYDDIKLLNNTKKNTPVLTDDQLDILQKPLSHEKFEIIEKVILNWPYDQLIPALDILRALIIEPNARDIIPAKNMIGIAQYLGQADADQSSESLISNISRVFVNMFLNYTGEILTEINVFEIISKFADSFSSFEKDTQISFSTLIFNYSTLLYFNREICIELMMTIIDILTPEINEAAILNLLLACGNLIIFSDEAKLKLQLNPDIIQDLISDKLTDECNDVVTNIVNLMSQSS